MKICRFRPDRIGVVLGDQIADVTEAVAERVRVAWPAPVEDAFIARLADLRAVIEAALPGAVKLDAARVEFLSPVANPGKIVAAPVNYLKHLEEAVTDPALHHGNAIKHIEAAGLFLKATSSLIGASDPIRIRFPDRRNDHEVELAVIIGKTAQRVSPEDALDYVAGYAIGLDMTVRGPEDRSFRKSPDSYTVIGPWLVTADEFGSPEEVDLKLWVGDGLRQSANTRDLILGVRALIAFASQWYSLHPGDILITGTPEGVGPVAAGDRIRAWIAGVGEMSVDVIS